MGLGVSTGGGSRWVGERRRASNHCAPTYPTAPAVGTEYGSLKTLQDAGYSAFCSQRLQPECARPPPEDAMSTGTVNHWRIASWFLLMTLACIIFLGAYRQSEPPGRTVEAQEFVLKDSSGRVRARLGMKNDQASIEFYDERGSVTWTSPSASKIKPIEIH